MNLRNLFSSMHSVVLLSIAFLIALFSYLVLRSYHYRFDLSPNQAYSLSTQTIQILEAMSEDEIRVTGFFREGHASKRPFEDLLQEYAYRHPKFRYEFYDPDRWPGKTKQYGIDAYESIVIEAKGKREITKHGTEEAITNLLAKLYRDETKTIFFTKGSGAPSLEDVEQQSEYGLLAKRLKEANYEIRETVLLRDGIPHQQADLLVVGGLKMDLVPEEVQVVRDYLKSGGRVLVMMDPVDPGEGKNLERFIAEYGVALGSDVIVDKLSKLFGADYLIPLITEYRPHAITRGFQLASFFPVARTVRKVENASGDLEITELAWTGSGSWAEKNLKKMESGTADFDQKEDELGPVPIAVAVSHPKEKWRLVVFGDSEFVANGYLNLSGNKDLILNTFAWLTGDEFAISIRPRERKATPLFLKETDQQFLFFVPVLGLPFVFLATGTGIFFWRRKFH